ncbi:hypothetical protein H696_02241 [Fonticula alba]|uniref:Ras-GEF domain-containing protein n=1 Tax=Fonticula alba TaxID=691883 RepID=A0A058ZAF3_FONAL|nr:hypothetical protein H696_02241 [Fonticula alba]KCV71295.1 hypothetical protein H696_02241 [Fonticula alba]|eukprot:XP_009494418.1 hypothetical protein H696_02241 [Fonticula alba]
MGSNHIGAASATQHPTPDLPAFTSLQESPHLAPVGPGAGVPHTTGKAHPPAMISTRVTLPPAGEDAHEAMLATRATPVLSGELPPPPRKETIALAAAGISFDPFSPAEVRSRAAMPQRPDFPHLCPEAATIAGTLFSSQRLAAEVCLSHSRPETRDSMPISAVAGSWVQLSSSLRSLLLDVHFLLFSFLQLDSSSLLAQESQLDLDAILAQTDALLQTVVQADRAPPAGSPPASAPLRTAYTNFISAQVYAAKTFTTHPAFGRLATAGRTLATATNDYIRTMARTTTSATVLSPELLEPATPFELAPEASSFVQHPVPRHGSSTPEPSISEKRQRGAELRPIITGSEPTLSAESPPPSPQYKSRSIDHLPFSGSSQSSSSSSSGSGSGSSTSGSSNSKGGDGAAAASLLNPAGLGAPSPSASSRHRFVRKVRQLVGKPEPTGPAFPASLYSATGSYAFDEGGPGGPAPPRSPNRAGSFHGGLSDLASGSMGNGPLGAAGGSRNSVIGAPPAWTLPSGPMLVDLRPDGGSDLLDDDSLTYSTCSLDGDGPSSGPPSGRASFETIPLVDGSTSATRRDYEPSLYEQDLQLEHPDLDGEHLFDLLEAFLSAGEGAGEEVTRAAGGAPVAMSSVVTSRPARRQARITRAVSMPTSPASATESTAAAAAAAAAADLSATTARLSLPAPAATAAATDARATTAIAIPAPPTAPPPSDLGPSGRPHSSNTDEVIFQLLLGRGINAPSERPAGGPPLPGLLGPQTFALAPVAGLRAFAVAPSQQDEAYDGDADDEAAAGPGAGRSHSQDVTSTPSEEGEDVLGDLATAGGRFAAGRRATVSEGLLPQQRPLAPGAGALPVNLSPSLGSLTSARGSSSSCSSSSSSLSPASGLSACSSNSSLVAAAAAAGPLFAAPYSPPSSGSVSAASSTSSLRRGSLFVPASNQLDTVLEQPMGDDSDEDTTITLSPFFARFAASATSGAGREGGSTPGVRPMSLLFDRSTSEHVLLPVPSAGAPGAGPRDGPPAKPPAPRRFPAPLNDEASNSEGDMAVDVDGADSTGSMSDSSGFDSDRPASPSPGDPLAMGEGGLSEPLVAGGGDLLAAATTAPCSSDTSGESDSPSGDPGTASEESTSREAPTAGGAATALPAASLFSDMMSVNNAALLAPRKLLRDDYSLVYIPSLASSDAIAPAQPPARHPSTGNRALLAGGAFAGTLTPVRPALPPVADGDSGPGGADSLEAFTTGALSPLITVSQSNTRRMVYPSVAATSDGPDGDVGSVAGPAGASTPGRKTTKHPEAGRHFDRNMRILRTIAGRYGHEELATPATLKRLSLTLGVPAVGLQAGSAADPEAGSKCQVPAEAILVRHVPTGENILILELVRGRLEVVACSIGHLAERLADDAPYDRRLSGSGLGPGAADDAGSGSGAGSGRLTRAASTWFMSASNDPPLLDFEDTADLVDSVLLTHSQYMSHVDLFSVLMSRFNARALTTAEAPRLLGLSDDLIAYFEEVSDSLRRKVLNVLSRWLRFQWVEFEQDRLLLSLLRDFMIQGHYSLYGEYALLRQAFHNCVYQALRRIEPGPVRGRRIELLTIQAASAGADRPLSRSASLRSVGSSRSSSSSGSAPTLATSPSGSFSDRALSSGLVGLSPQTAALFISCHNAYLAAQVQPIDWFTYAVASSNQRFFKNDPPAGAIMKQPESVVRLFRREHQLTQWVGFEVCSGETARARKDIFRKVLKIIRLARDMHDFLGAFALYNGLFSPPILRLKSVWSSLSKSDMAEISKLGKFFEPRNNMRTYRARIERLASAPIPVLRGLQSSAGRPVPPPRPDRRPATGADVDAKQSGQQPATLQQPQSQQQQSQQQQPQSQQQQQQQQPQSQQPAPAPVALVGAVPIPMIMLREVLYVLERVPSVPRDFSGLVHIAKYRYITSILERHVRLARFAAAGDLSMARLKSYLDHVDAVSETGSAPGSAPGSASGSVASLPAAGSPSTSGPAPLLGSTGGSGTAGGGASGQPPSHHQSGSSHSVLQLLSGSGAAGGGPGSGALADALAISLAGPEPSSNPPSSAAATARSILQSLLLLQRTIDHPPDEEELMEMSRAVQS